MKGSPETPSSREIESRNSLSSTEIEGEEMSWNSTSLSSLSRLLLQYAEHKKLLQGRPLHAHIITAGLAADSYLGNAIVSFYTKCGRIFEARHAFEWIENKDVVSWNCLINGCSQQGPEGADLTLGLFWRMRAEGGVYPNSYTFTGVFTAASLLLDSCYGREAHALTIKAADFGDDVFVGSSLLNMYCKLGLLDDARKVFDRMPCRNSVSWAAIITGYASDKCVDEAFGLFILMLEEARCSVNEFIITSVLSAVSLPEFVDRGEQIHSQVIKNGLSSFVPVRNSLVTMYTKCCRLDNAMQLFEFSSDRNSITWSAIITGYTQNGHPNDALRLFSKMHCAGMSPSEFTFVGVLNACSDRMALTEGRQVHSYLLKMGYVFQMFIKSALVGMYARCGSVNDARNGFDQIQEPDVVLWTTMIGGYVQNGENEEALSLYGRMEMEGMSPNDLTMASLLRACSSLAALEQGKQIHARSLKYGFGLEVPIGSALSTMYAKCGSLEDGYLVFRKMPNRDIVAWNSILSAFAQNGYGHYALELFDEMKSEGEEPDHVTFVNLLCSCSHMGSVEKGWSYFKAMCEDYHLIPRLEHYACMVDLLSRAGMLDRAKEFIEAVPIDHGVCLWRIVLGACRGYKNFKVGAYAGERLMELGSQDPSAYVLLANIYATSRRWDDMERVRRLMRLRGVNKEPGCSWIELGNRVHVFVVGDQQHPEIKEIYVEVRKLTRHMKDEDYQPVLEFPSDGFSNVDKGLDDEEESQVRASVSYSFA